MKFNRFAWLPQHKGETIATFGGARLVKMLNGKIELIGGTRGDHADAREWCSLFMHEAVVATPGNAPRCPVSSPVA